MAVKGPTDYKNSDTLCADHGFLDGGYRDIEVDDVRILRTCQGRGITRILKAMIQRRSDIKATMRLIKMQDQL